MTTVAKAPAKPDLKMVPLNKIVVSKTNPRKTFDVDAIVELSESIKTKGVIQPVLLRPYPGGKYELVCGERRYRASQMVLTQDPAHDCKEIPAYIRELTDAEALELQLTENLQRKDVHPMDEASSFHGLLATGRDINIVAATVGKTPAFINQRIKLMDLTDTWQKVFFHGGITIVDALRIAHLTKKNQEEFWDDNGIPGDNFKGMKQLKFSQWDWNKYQGKLIDAPFSLDDATLDKKAGACVSCQFNSGAHSLFPEGSADAMCGNVSCYKAKVDVFFGRELKVAIEEPGVILITSSNSSTKEAADIRKQKHDVYDRSQYHELHKPEATTYEEYKDDEYEWCDTEDEFLKGWEERQREDAKELEQYNEKIATGKYLKAFIVDTDRRGNYTYVTLVKKSANEKGTVGKSKEEPEGLTIFEIQEEIDRIATKEKRAKELDIENVHSRVNAAIRETIITEINNPTTTAIGRSLARYLIYNELPYDARKVIKKKFGIEEPAYRSDNGFEDFVKKLNDLSEEDLLFIVRTVAIHKYGNYSSPLSVGGWFIRQMAIASGVVPVLAFDLEQKEKADRRNAKVTKSIADLQARKKELEDAKKKKPAAGKGIKALLNDAPVKKATKK